MNNIDNLGNTILLAIGIIVVAHVFGIVDILGFIGQYFSPAAGTLSPLQKHSLDSSQSNVLDNSSSGVDATMPGLGVYPPS